MSIIEKILDGVVAVLSLIHPREPKKKEPPKSKLLLTDDEIGCIICWYNIANFERGSSEDERALREKIVNAVADDGKRDYFRQCQDF